MAAPRTLTRSATAAIVLLALGAVTSFWSVGWWVDRSYGVYVWADEGVSWTLWIPHHSVPMPWNAEGSVQVAGSASTPYGLLLNITGSGSARLRFFTTAVGFAEKPWHVGLELNLSGHGGGPWPSRYHVWRDSSDPSANISIGGGLGLQGHRLGEDWQCGGPRYSGWPSEGWSEVPERFWDCLGSGYFLPGVIPAALLMPGTVLAVVELHRRRRP